MRHAIVLGVLVAVLLAVQPAWSQETRGTILGRVTDSTGAVVPGATVRLTHVATKTVRTTETNAQGNYSAPFLPAGVYEITAEKQGFKRFVRGGIDLHINDNLEVNLALEVGALTESITVTAESPLLETASGSIGQVVDTRRASELPLTLGNTMDLIRLASATNYGIPTFALDQPWEPWTGTGYTMAGSNQASMEVTMDGAANTAQDGAAWPTKNVAAFNPPPDAVAEMKIQTVTFDGTVGNTEGGLINVSLKSGTNALHGTAYYSFTPTALTANLWFSNKWAIPRPDSDVKRWGGVANGPVYLGKLYNGKNKTFFMYSYEGTRYASVRSSNLTVPTAAQRAGDLSGLLAIGPQYQIYNPFSRRAIGGGRYQEDPISNNMITSVRPVDPIAIALMNPKNYSLPTTAGDSADGANNYPRPDATQEVKYLTTLGRIDHNFSEKHRFFMRADKSATTIADPVLFGPDSIYSTTWFWNKGRGFAMDDVYLWNPSTVMNLKLSDAAWIRASDSNPAGVVDLTKEFGFSSFFNNLWDPGKRRTPQVSIDGYSGFSGANQAKNWRPQETRAAAVAFDKIRGAHGFKFGFEYRQLRMNNYSYGVNTEGGVLNYDSTYTKGPYDNSPSSPRGQGLAAFLLGLPSSGFGSVVDSFSDMSTYWAGYFEDDLKVSRKLTLNLSLRYELEGPLTERYNRTVLDFDPTAKHTGNFDALAAAAYAANPINERPVSTWSTLGGIRYAGVNGAPRELMNRDFRKLMPRIGFAYSLNTKTVLRGGYGMYYSSLGQRFMDPIQTNYNQDTQLVATQDSGLSFLASTSNPFPNGLLQPYKNTLGADTYLGQSISYFTPDIKASRIQKFQFDIQRELPTHLLFDVGYIYSRTTGYITTRDAQVFPSKYLSTSPSRDQTVIDYWSANVPNPFKGLVPGTGMNGDMISRDSLVRNYPQFAWSPWSHMNNQTNEGGVWYNAMVTRVERRFAQGYTLSWSWTWSKTMEETGFLNPDDPKPEHVISASDYPHHMQASFIYELPFGRGRPLRSTIGRAGDSIIGGWQVSGVWTLQSGNALGFPDVIYYGGNLRDILLPADVRNTARWFDTSKFEKASSVQLDRHYRTLSSRFSWFRGSRLNQWDMSVIKNTRITEKTSFQFRAEALNAFNQVWFGGWGGPDTNPTSGTFGQFNGENSQPRKIQLMVKLVF